MGILNKIDQMLKKIKDINNRMHAAATDDERKEISKELVGYVKDINILLYPEDQKDKDTLSLK
jgi:protein subunit release factor A